MAERVIIKEVAARDGLQAQPKHLTVEQRIALLGALAEAGVLGLDGVPFADAARCEHTGAPVQRALYLADPKCCHNEVTMMSQ